MDEKKRFKTDNRCFINQDKQWPKVLLLFELSSSYDKMWFCVADGNFNEERTKP